jgi:hypothetical protein
MDVWDQEICVRCHTAEQTDNLTREAGAHCIQISFHFSIIHFHFSHSVLNSVYMSLIGEKRSRADGPSPQTSGPGTSCPFIGSIHRERLDFGFQRVCSVTLSDVNVYVCLVCGEYFRGRGSKTPACAHALEEQHHLFIKFSSGRVYCLPDDYEVVDPSLEDIQLNLNPEFTRERVEEMDTKQVMRRGVDGESFPLGLIGLNRTKFSDYINAVLQVFARAIPFRNFFLLDAQNIPWGERSLSFVLGFMFRRMWNPWAFRSHLSMHQLLHMVHMVSKGIFDLDHQHDPIKLINWMLNTLDLEWKTMKKRDSANAERKIKGPSIVDRFFRGTVHVHSTLERVASVDEEMEAAAMHVEKKRVEIIEETTKNLPFQYALSCFSFSLLAPYKPLDQGHSS